MPRHFMLSCVRGALVFFALIGAGCVKPAAVSANRGDFRAPRNPPRVEYTIRCTIGPTVDRLTAREMIRITNTTTMPLRRLQLRWPAGSEKSAEIKGNGEPLVLVHDSKGLETDPMVIEIPHPLVPGESLAIDMEFSLSSPSRTDQSLFVDWYPQVYWGYPTHADYRVKVRAPPGYVVATSGPLDPASGWYNIRHAESFGMFVAKGLRSKESQSGDVVIQCFFTEKGEACANLILETATDVVNFYHDRFGFYPYASLTIVPGQEFPVGGFPVATGMVAIHGMERMPDASPLHWRWITAHEIGHEYWYEYVMPLDSSQWLLIGLGMYFDREYVLARKLGPGEHHKLMSRYLDGVRKGLDTTITRSPEQMAEVKFDFNNVVVHGKGFSVMSALANCLGRKVFERIGNRCLKEFGGRYLDLGRFRSVCEEESGQDLGWFFDQWVGSNRHLSYDAEVQSSERTADDYLIEVKATCRGSLTMPVPLAAYFEDGTVQVQFTDRLLKEQQLHFKGKSPLREIRLDPNEELALIFPPLTQANIAMAKRIRALRDEGEQESAIAVFNEATQGGLQVAGGSWFHLGLALYDAGHYSEALDAFGRASVSREMTPDFRLGALVWQGHMLDLLDRREEALQAYKKSLSVEGFHYVRHSQYGIEVNRAWVEERLRTPFSRE